MTPSPLGVTLEVGMHALPESAVIVGSLWRCVALPLPPNLRPSGQPYLRGERTLSDASREALLRTMVKVFVESSFVRRDGKAEEILMSALEGLALKWDHFVGAMRSISATRVKPAAVALPLLRKATIEVALRAAAFDLLFPPPAMPVAMVHDGDVPCWARNGGVQALLRGLPKALGVKRDQLHAQKTKDDWLDGRSRPSVESLEAFAQSLAKHDRTKAAASAWEHHLAWTFALGALADQLAALVGRDAVEDLATELQRLRRRIGSIFSSVDQLPDVLRPTMVDMVVRGPHADFAVQLMDTLVLHDAEANRVRWLTDLRAACADWAGSIMTSLVVSSEPVMPTGVPADVLLEIATHMFAGDMNRVFKVCDGHPQALLWLARTTVQQAAIRGDFASVAPMVTRFAIITNEPQLHLEAAVLQAAAGSAEQAMPHIAALPPDHPVAEPMSQTIPALLSSSGRHAEALAHLERIERTTTLDYFYALSLRASGRVEEALDVLDRILGQEPDHALAREHAAECCWELGRKVDGNRHARRARALGRRPQHRRRRSMPA